MGSNRSHRQGGKFKGHTSVIAAAIPVVDTLVKMEEVTGISISKISQTRSVAHATVVSHKETVSGLEVKVRGNKYVQTFYVYMNLSNRPAVVQMLERSFPRPQARKRKKGKKRRRQRHDVPRASEWNNKP